ncbi:nucleoporin Nup120/160-domain-containing protein [Kockovaella imperatae]|uniref:Nucleoporin Nup120/160-domain-containing protein n=1 Tax=Kockovaella imperatae TaxID=4999 RepID=A0A1Y1UQB2_9TREE|nr:nucleoporin Nup120/160-domain-containing protein [Kockovaella imperatae]ORX40189.1 nucleoporin Nup120/160-domain-containing protein [Kockovaella imperatae]
MPSTYVSHQLVAAHLPPPPSLPLSIPELRITTRRSFPGREETDQPLHPAHALSTSYNPDLNVLARVIHNGHRLELRPFDIVKLKSQVRDESGTDTLQILFPEPLRALSEGTIILSNADRKVYIIVVSESNTVYRLSFPLGRFKSERGARFIFMTTGGVEWCEEFDVPEDVISQAGGVCPVAIVDSETVVLGGADGGIIRVIRSLNTWTATHHRVSSRFRLPSLFSSASSDDQVLSFAQYDGEVESTFYALSRDGKLRVWSLDTGALVKTIDVQSAISTSKQVILAGQTGASTSQIIQDASEVNLIRIIETPNASSPYSHVIVVFVGSPGSSTSAGTFAVYRVSRSSNDFFIVGERISSHNTTGGTLRNFDIVPPSAVKDLDTGWTLWTTWDIKGSIICESITMDDLFQFTTYAEPSDPPYLLYEWQTASPHPDTDNMDAAYFDNILSLDPPDPTLPLEHPDIPETFIRHLFYPGRFSSLSLSTALEEYCARLSEYQDWPQLNNSYSCLSRKMAAIVGCTIAMDTHPQTGAPAVDIFRRDTKLEWLGVWSRVRELDKHARWPVGNAVVDDQQIVICRESVLVPISMDTAELIAKFASDDEVLSELSESALAVYPLIDASTSRTHTLVVAAAGEQLLSTLADLPTEDGLSNCLDAFFAQLDLILSSSLQSPVEQIADDLWDEFLDACLTEEERTNTRRVLSECDDLEQGLVSLLDILTDLSASAIGSSQDNLAFAGLGNSIITSTIISVIDVRYTLVRYLVLVAIFHLVESDLTPDTQEGESIIAILARSLALYHRYRALSWLSEQTAEEARQYARDGLQAKRKPNSGDMLTDGFGGLQVGDERSTTDTDGFEVDYSVIHSLLAHQKPQTVQDEVVDLIADGASSFLSSLHVISPDMTDNESRPGDVKLGYLILIDNQPTAARAFTDLYPLSAGMAYVKGRACLELGDSQEASRLLRLASVDVDTEALANILPPAENEDRLTSFYRHVTSLFEEHGLDDFVVTFGEMALNSTGEDDLKDIRTKVFLANLSLKAYEDAYVVLNGASNMDLRKDFLGQLISHMCEANEIGRLNALGFVGLQQEVEKLIRFKARHSDPVRYPNYYKVLYSWHVSRGDYRSAGEIMYLQARRLDTDPGKSSSPLSDLAVMQARSYLASINCMSMVDKTQAWIAIPAPRTAPKREAKRRRVTSYIPESAMGKDKHRMELITLADIKAEYSAVLAKLHLANIVDDIFADGHITIGPSELVGLLVQHAMFDLALSSAASLEVDMTDVFVALASRCVQLSRSSTLSGGVEARSIAFLFSSPITSRLRGPAPALALRYLQVALTRYDSTKSQWKYREAVAETFFEMNLDKRNGWQMPVWLVDWEMNRNAEGWIGKAVKWGWIEEAIDWSMQHLASMDAPELLPGKRAGVAYTPFNLFDRVIAAASESSGKDDARVQEKSQRLRAALKSRVAGLKKVK